MTLDRRLVKLEVARGFRLDPEADAAFVRLAAWLDRLSALKAAGDVKAQRGIEALDAFKAWVSGRDRKA